jgi:DNA repair ATPase RecN
MYDEETEEFVGGVEELSGKIADLTKTAKTPGGISLFSNETKTEYKSTRELFDDISEIYQELNDKQQAGLLEALAGKRNGQAVAAILNNYEAVTDSLNSMANSAGNAEKEMSIAMDSIDFKVNKLKETGTGIAQNLFQREDMKIILDTLTSFMEMLDKVTEKLGLFGTIGLGAGLFTGIKNVGKRRSTMFHNCFEYADRDRCFLYEIGFLSPIVKYTLVNEATISVEII